MTPDLYRELGLRPVINASATLTALGGSRMPPQVSEAMAVAARSFVDLGHLQCRIGERLAEMTRNQAAYVCSGAAAGIALAVAACLTREQPEEAGTLPDVHGLHRPHVVTLLAHRNPYQVAIRITGGHEREIEGTRGALAAALEGGEVACVVFFAGAHWTPVELTLADVIEVAHARGVPVIVDAAAQIPPVATLWRFTAGAGADAVVVSGGKALRGPQSSGLVLGASWLIEGCRALGSPNRALGRPMKVGKEEMVGLLRAVELALEQDEVALLAGYEAMVDGWLEGLQGLPGIEGHRSFPSEAGQPHSRALVTLADGAAARDQVVRRLLAGDPSVAVGIVGDASIALNPQTVDPAEAPQVLDALRRAILG